MPERYTHRAQRVLDFAKEEADTLGNNYIGVEHLLLGLARQGEQESPALPIGIALADLRDAIVAVIVGKPAAAADALERARDHALDLDHGD